MKNESILHDWVTRLGLRHQGVLMGCIRGCDTVPKEDPAKHLVRCLRSTILKAHCGDASKAKTFMEDVPATELYSRMSNFFSYGFDHYPNHYVTHLMQAVEIVGYKLPDVQKRILWETFYKTLVKKLHLNIETEAELDKRLNKNEEDFYKDQQN